jgi:hypothetical protein
MGSSSPFLTSLAWLPSNLDKYPFCSRAEGLANYLGNLAGLNVSSLGVPIYQRPGISHSLAQWHGLLMTKVKTP